jgi:hypothetical protein
MTHPRSCAVCAVASEFKYALELLDNDGYINANFDNNNKIIDY